MKSESSVPFYIQQFARHLLANYQFFPPRKDRLLALVEAANDENLKDFYKRLADSDPEQVKKLILLFIMIDPDFAFERSDVEIKAQKELIPRIREAAQLFVEVSSEYLKFFPFSPQQPFISEEFRIDLPMDYLKEMEALRKTMVAVQEFLLLFQSHTPYVDQPTEYVLSSRKKTAKTRRIRRLIHLFFEQKIELKTRSIPAVLSLGLEIIGDENVDVQQVTNLFSKFSRFMSEKSSE